MTFERGGEALSPDASAIADSLCRQHNLTRQELYIKWEAYAFSRAIDTALPAASDLQGLANHLRLQSTKSTTKPAQKISAAHVSKSSFYAPKPLPQTCTFDDFFSYVDEPQESHPIANPTQHTPQSPALSLIPDNTSNDNPDTPSNNDHFPLAASDVVRPSLIELEADALPDKDYISRDRSGRVEATLNGSPELEDGPISTQALQVQPVPSLLSDSKNAFRYMNDDIPNRIEMVRSHLRTTVTRILDRLATLRAVDDPVRQPKPESFSAPSAEVVMAAGIIRVELDGSEGAVPGSINDRSVILESEDGNLVKLDLSRVLKSKTPLFLHPGMVVIVEGINTNGRVFQVHALYDNAMPVVQDRRVDEGTGDDEILPDASQPTMEPSVTALFVAGPYTTSKNLNYEPLDDLLTVVARCRPNVVFMGGPFLDADHAQISAATPVSFRELFENRVLHRIYKALADMGEEVQTKFVLIPALGDVHHEFVCPQPPFKQLEGDVHKGICMVSNPSVVQLTLKNGSYSAAVGVSTLPALQDLSADSICVFKSDRFSAICSNMLRQCSFYPMFPSTAAVPLDTSYLSELNIPDIEGYATVDILMTPSRLQAFAKSVDGGAVAINPGLLCRGSTGGTYAEVRIPLHKAWSQRSKFSKHAEVKVNIVRI